ncbi:MAG: malto-oligosyltrehalose synthase [Proteobacteria bacterium]|nr:MAG: malto-oligosyltrehalose synthase [Pseudomonadota bacterium]
MATRMVRATQRLQLHAGFTLQDAAALVPYLARLGVSHVYASPFLQAARGSTHGYDVVDPTRIGDEFGGDAGFAALRDALARASLGLVVDVVANHMAIAPENRWWWDVLENGPSSRFAAFFDVDWEPPEARLRNLVLVPVLADHYGRVLEAGELRLERDGARFQVRYHEHALPIAPPTLDGLLADAAARCETDAAEELAFLAGAFGRLPLATATDEPSVARRHRDKEVLRRALARLLAASPEVAGAIDAVVAAHNADPDALDALLERQNWRLARWRMGERDVGYRRFFDIDHLVGLRVEESRVFAETHACVLGWVRDGVADGLRIDHLDGMREPARYLRQLREAAPRARIWVEKILDPGERLPASWPVEGTTGYEFANRVLGLLLDPAGEKALVELHGELVGEAPDPAQLVHDAKRAALRGGLAADLGRLSALALAVCERHREFRDYTRHELQQALAEIAACFPVYRAYPPDEGVATGDDAARIRAACAAARVQRSDLEGALFDVLERLLLGEIDGRLERELKMRFQQLAAPAHAKGVEDTAFYAFTRFAAANEVGARLGAFGVSPDAFHAACRETLASHPETLLATSTHDTKRSEDVRARLALLSEMPERWADAVRAFRARNERLRRGGAPDRSDEYLFYQTLVGAWPLSEERALAYMEKAAREAKTHTSWTHPDAAYEDALRGFVSGALGDAAFVRDVEAFVAPLVVPGRVNSLVQTLLKLTAPGVPDLYQGSELWDLSLVDPDNRRPVDWALRRRLLDELPGLAPDTIWRRHESGLPKLWTIERALDLRRRRPEAFGREGGYEALAAEGARAGHVVAFARGGAALTVVPRLVLGADGDWRDTALPLPPGRFRNVLDPGGDLADRVAIGALFARFPVALLERTS